MKKPPLTHHGIQRGKERAGLDKRALERTAGKALASGLQAADVNGRLRRYIDGMLIQHKGSDLRIHGNHIYAFRNDVLITVLDLPLAHRRAALSALQRKNRKEAK